MYCGQRLQRTEKIGSTEIIVPNTKTDSTKCIEYQKDKSRMCKSRAAIEPVISHIKYDCRMARNFLKGQLGDKINALMAGAAFNLRAIREKGSLWLQNILRKIEDLELIKHYQLQLNINNYMLFVTLTF